MAYDPAWPAAFQRWRDRLAGELGDAALRVEHVGSTAVPGLAAKPTIDIQVSVALLEEETRYVPGVEATGLVLRSRDDYHRFFRPPADRARDVHVHVCPAGSAWEREHLLLRDYLRTHEQASRAYAAAKTAAKTAVVRRPDRLHGGEDGHRAGASRSGGTVGAHGRMGPLTSYRGVGSRGSRGGSG